MMDNLLDQMKKAEAGDAQAQYDVTWHMVWEHQRDALHPDWAARAVDYFKRAVARMLHPKTFRCLGYWLGISTRNSYQEPVVSGADYRAAFGYFFKGAVLEEQNSLYEVGDMFFAGKYVDRDRKLAFRLYARSAQRAVYLSDDSYADACLRLAECYLRGIGCEQDLDEARLCLGEALESYEIRIARGDLDALCWAVITG